MKLKIFVYELPLKHTFTIAHQSRDFQESIVVQLEDGEFSGLGECTTNPYYGMTRENIINAMEMVRSSVESNEWKTPEALWKLNQVVLKNNPFAHCALDVAAWDIFVKRQGRKLYEWLNLDPKDIP